MNKMLTACKTRTVKVANVLKTSKQQTKDLVMIEVRKHCKKWKTRRLHNTECGRESRSLPIRPRCLRPTKHAEKASPTLRIEEPPKKKNRNQQAYSMQVQKQVQLQDHEDHPLPPKSKNHTAGTDLQAQTGTPWKFFLKTLHPFLLNSAHSHTAKPWSNLWILKPAQK